MKPVKNGHGRSHFPGKLPREVVEIDLPEDERQCWECGQEMKLFGEEVCERGHVIPAHIIVRRYVRKKYAFPAVHAVACAPPPPAPLEKCKYEAGPGRERF